MHIAVLGGGNGAFAAAGDLALAGHDMRLWRRDRAAVAAHHAAGGMIVVKDFSGRRQARPNLITSDIGAAVRGCELILAPVPATAQADIAAALAPHLADGQVVFLPTGVFPLVRKEHALGIIRRAFPGVIEDCGDALSAALMNAGPVIHPPLIVINAGALQHSERWDIHKEGTQPAIRRVTDALDGERIAVREALGYRAPHFPLANHYARDGEEWMYGRGSHDRLTDSGDWRERIVLTEHRYMLEDTRMGLSFLISVSDLAGVATPLARAFLAIGSAICSEDFMTTGRTLSGMGLGHLDRGALNELLANGFVKGIA
jgi:opine dehydrogenase